MVTVLCFIPIKIMHFPLMDLNTLYVRKCVLLLNTRKPDILHKNTVEDERSHLQISSLLKARQTKTISANMEEERELP